jgi:hypothetical protein
LVVDFKNLNFSCEDNTLREITEIICRHGGRLLEENKKEREKPGTV